MSLLIWLMPAFVTNSRSADVPVPKSLRRESRLLSRQEIFQAIQSNLAQQGISERGGLRPEDLKIQSSLPALSDDTGLQVKRIGFDPLRREVVFELWASHEPQFLPFEVTTRRDPRTWGYRPATDGNQGTAYGSSRNETSATRQSVRPTGPRLPVLAKPGKPATLVILGQNMRITTTVVPLQPGSKGQSILVRDATTARVMKADVVGEDLLQTSF